MSVVLLLLVWVILLVIGFAMMFWTFGASSFGTTLSLSGSAITTNWMRSQKAQMPEIMRRHSAKIYTHIYPQWDIAFACVFDYTDSQEDCPVGVIGW